MWRQNPFLKDQESDQSISDEEDFNAELQNNCASLGERSGKKEGLQLQSRLDILKGTNAVNYGRKSINLSPKKQTSDSLEDDVEMPHFPGEDGSICSKSKKSGCNVDEQGISDDETFHVDEFHNLGRGTQDWENKWSVATMEAEALIHLNEKAFCPKSHSSYSKAKNSCKGMKSKSKPKFSFHFHSHKAGASSPSFSEDGSDELSTGQEVAEQSQTIDNGKHSIVELLDDFNGKEAKLSEDVLPEFLDLHQFTERSMAEHLDGIWDKTSPPRKSSKMYSRTRGKKPEVVGDRTADSEHLTEIMCSISSSDDEMNNQNRDIAVPEMRRHTLADRFDALGATLNNEGSLAAIPRPSGIGLFGKLQQVIQSEKFTDAVFLKLQNRANTDGETGCINVEILSRYLDAKLIVCHTSSIMKIEGPGIYNTLVDGGWGRTIIFNPRVCCDVDLEVGNIIRIHPPCVDPIRTSCLFKSYKVF